MKTTHSNANLNAAKKAKNDEFYTQLSDIENELEHYKDQFRGKVVFCNCDDPRESNFVKFFRLNFEELGLKKLIATHYIRPELSNIRRPIKLEYTGRNTDDFITEMIGTGDFRSPECIELLKEADIVVTNPPFSLFREYVAQLVAHGKKFLIVGNVNAVTYKECFKLIKDGRLWLGHGRPSAFYIPGGGTTKQMMGLVRWFTNMALLSGHKELVLYKKYTPEEFPKYDNYDAINVNKLADIPLDYPGVMGVPITFMDKYNPDQFEIVGMCGNLDLYKMKTKVYSSAECKPAYLDKFGKNGTYDLNAIGAVTENGLLEKVYRRILIKKINRNHFEILGSNRGVDQDTNGVYGRSSFVNGKETFTRLFIKKINGDK